MSDCQAGYYRQHKLIHTSAIHPSSPLTNLFLTTSAYEDLSWQSRERFALSGFAVNEWRFDWSSERLAQAFFEMRAEAAADPGAGAAFEQDVELTMRNRLEL